MATVWSWPGARWWKCDLHVHSPGSEDFPDRATVTSEDWVNAARLAGLDVIAVTDHNNGSLIGPIKAAAVASGSPVVFPGVELTVTPGVHLLALFDPSGSADSVTGLLARCDIRDADRGKAVACSPQSLEKVLGIAGKQDAVCIASHINGPKGLLQVIPRGQSLISILRSEHLQGVEAWEKGDPAELEVVQDPPPEYARRLGSLPVLTSSDAHALADIGGRYTWIKMTRPDIEGLRLALLDGRLAVASMIDAPADPNCHAPLCIESIEIHETKFIGRREPFVLPFNPWLNALIGGRGTGKSSIVEFLRIVLRREAELPDGLRPAFDALRQVPATRKNRGLLTKDTQLSVVYRKNGGRYRIQWDQQGLLPAIQEERDDGSFLETQGDIPTRFPVRIFSQKQIFELAGDPDALVGIVDDAAQVDRRGWDEQWREEEKRFLALRAKQRELASGLLDEPRVRGELTDVQRKLKAFEGSDHAALLTAYQIGQRQRQALESWIQEVAGIVQGLRDAAEAGQPPEIEPTVFDPAQPEGAEVLAAVGELSQRIGKMSPVLRKLADRADGWIAQLQATIQSSGWQSGVAASEQAYTTLIETLATQDVRDPGEYGRLVKQQQDLQSRLRSLDARRESIEESKGQISESFTKLTRLRRELTLRRRRFLDGSLQGNPHVRITVAPFGALGDLEKDLRGLLGIGSAEGFHRDIDQLAGLLREHEERALSDRLSRVDQVPSGPESVEAQQQKADEALPLEEQLQGLKSGLVALVEGGPEPCACKDKRFADHLAKQKPEVFDRLLCWFPGDALDVCYSPRGDGKRFQPIDQGSPGQKTAALLAFLLAHGEEPLVLDQPEDDLDNHLIYDLVVQQLREIKRERQVIAVTHNANIVVNGDAELVNVLDAQTGRTVLVSAGGLQEQGVRDEICRVMEGGRKAFELRYRRMNTARNGLES